MVNMSKVISNCLPLCAPQPEQSDRELDSFPEAVARQPLKQSKPTISPAFEFQQLINKRILSLQQRRSFTEPEFQEDLDRQMQDAKNLEEMAEKLMVGVEREKSVVQLFTQVASNIRQHQLLHYESTALHNVYALASHRSGDCESVCKLYAFVAWSAGHKNIKLKQLKGTFNFKLDHDGIMLDRQKDDTFNFVLHTVLQSKDNSGKSFFFDPLFGQCVDISGYGEGLDRYLGKTESAIK